MQAAGKKLEADISDLKTRLKTQETETRKANAKFVSSIATQEKLKTDFDAEPGRTGGEGSLREDHRTLRLKAPSVSDGCCNLR